MPGTLFETLVWLLMLDPAGLTSKSSKKKGVIEAIRCRSIAGPRGRGHVSLGHLWQKDHTGVCLRNPHQSASGMQRGFFEGHFGLAKGHDIMLHCPS